MSNLGNAKQSSVQAGIPTWDDEKQLLRMRAWYRALAVLIVVLWLALIIWVLVFAPIAEAPAAQLAVGASMAMVLAPVLAAAAAVERTLETTFNVIEGSWHTMVAYLGRGLRWLKSAETEVKQARQFLADVSEKYSAELQGVQFGQVSASVLADNMQGRIDAANRIMAMAQKRLEDAEGNLAAATSSDSYTSAKAGVSIILGLMLGVVIAGVGQLQMFAMLGIGMVPARIDVLITGLIIGSGAYPVHSLVGILQQGKDTLDSVKGFYNRSAPSVQQRITSLLPSSASPTSQPAVIETTAKSSEESPHN